LSLRYWNGKVELMLNWYLLQTVPNREKQAAFSLRDMGLDYYIPRYPGYCFLSLVAGQHDFNPIKCIPSINRFVFYGRNDEGANNYAIASPDLISFLRAEEALLGPFKSIKSIAPFVQAQTLRVREGLLADREALVLELSPEDRRVYLELVGPNGAPIRFWADYKDVEAVVS